MLTCGQIPSWQGCQGDCKLPCSPREVNLEKKFKPSITRLFKINCRPGFITQQSAGPALDCHSNHICGEWGVMGRETFRTAEGCSPSLGHFTFQRQGRQEASLWAAENLEHALKAVSTTRKPTDSLRKSRQAPSCLVQMQQCHLRGLQGSASFGASKYVLTVLAGPGTSLLKYVTSLYMSEVCAKHVHIPSAALGSFHEDT